MKNICHGPLPLYVLSGHVVVLVVLLIIGDKTSADPTISETMSSPESASSPFSPSSLSSSSRQKRAPGWGKRNELEEMSGVDLDAGYQAVDDDFNVGKRAPGWGKRAPGWGKRAPGWGGKRSFLFEDDSELEEDDMVKRALGWGKRAPGWGKRAPGWGKRSLSEDSLLEDDDTLKTDWNKRAPGWGKRAPGWGKRAPGWGKRAPGWGKRAPGWGKRAPGWGKRAPGWGKRTPANSCLNLDKQIEMYTVKLLKARQLRSKRCGNGDAANEADRK